MDCAKITATHVKQEIAKPARTPNSKRRLIDIAYGRSGDKGTGANVGILVRDQKDYETLIGWLTVERVAEYFAALELTEVLRYEIPNLGGLNFILRGALKRAGRTDASQGSALCSGALLRSRLKAGRCP